MKNVSKLFFFTILGILSLNLGNALAKNAVHIAYDHNYIDLSKKSKILNVKSFGAKGDGKTDDTDALNEAINFSENNIVFFPKGVYLSGPIRPKRNVKLLGEGRNIVTLKCRNQLNLDFIDLQTDKKLIIVGLTVDGNGVNQELLPNYPQAISVKLGSLVVQKCKVVNARNIAVYTYKAHDVLIENNIIDQGERKNGFFDCIQTRYTNNVSIQGNEIIGGWAGVRCLSYSKNINIINNMQRGAFMDVGLTVATSENVIIRGNSCVDNTRAGIEVDFVYNSQINKNIVKNNKSHGILIARYTLPNQENGEIAGKIRQGGATLRGKNSVISHNICSNNYGHGIAVNGVDNVLISDNTISTNNRSNLGYAGLGITQSTFTQRNNSFINKNYQKLSIDANN